MITEKNILMLAVAAGLTAFAAHGAETLKFQQGYGGYSGVVDTMFVEDQIEGGYNYGASTTLVAQGDDFYAKQAILIRFDGIFGSGPRQIPLGETIISAKLVFYLQSDVITNPNVMKGIAAYPMLVSLPNFGNKDGAPASISEVTCWHRAHSQLHWGPPTNLLGPEPDVDYDTTQKGYKDYTYAAVPSFIELNVRDIVLAWYSGQRENYGFLVRGITVNTFSSFPSSEYLGTDYRPYLELVYAGPECGDAEHPYPPGDFNQDCWVDVADFAILTATWLECTDLESPCNYVPEL